MNKKYNEINISECIDGAIKKGISRAKHSKKRKIMVSVSSIAVLCLVFTAGTFNPAIAQNIPVASNIFQYLNSKAEIKDPNAPKYQYKYSDDVNQTSKDNGIEITINESYCDGINAFLTYTLKSDKKIDKSSVSVNFLETKTSIEGIDEKVPMYKQDCSGKLCDDNTYVGMVRFELRDEAVQKINDQGYLNMKFNISELFIGQDGQDINFFNKNYGNWNFNVKLNKDNQNIKEITPKLTDNGYTLDKIIMTPASTVIQVSSEEAMSDGTLIEVIDNNHKHVEWLNGTSLNDNKIKLWSLEAVYENAKTLKIGFFDKNDNSRKLAEFNIDIGM